MPPEQRRKLKLAGKRQYIKRNFTKQELTDYLIDNKIKSTRQLNKKRNKEDPTVYDYKKVFQKKWGEVLSEVYNLPYAEQPDHSVDAKYLVNAVIHHDLWTFRRYLAARKRWPEIFPAYNQILKQWGRFSNLKVIAKMCSVRHSMEEYILLKKNLGKNPTIAECKGANIFIEKAMDHFGGKINLDSFITELEKMKS